MLESLASVLRQVAMNVFMGHQSLDLCLPVKKPLPRSAYIHVPFCQHRCGYCNFTLIANRDDLIGKYLRAILLELQTLGKPHAVDTLFIGGGTPTYLPPERLQQLLDLVKGWFPLDTGGEFSVEANPHDVTDRTARILSQAGVTRVSLGAQSFIASKLQALERTHSEADIARALFFSKNIGSTSHLI